MLRFLFLLLISSVFLQGAIRRSYIGYGIAYGDVEIVIDGVRPRPDSFSVYIKWTESLDSLWARAIIIPIESKPNDTIDFIRVPNNRGWFLESLNGKERDHYLHGRAHQNNDTIKISVMHGMSGTSYNAKWDRE